MATKQTTTPTKSVKRDRVAFLGACFYLVISFSFFYRLETLKKTPVRARVSFFFKYPQPSRALVIHSNKPNRDADRALPRRDRVPRRHPPGLFFSVETCRVRLSSQRSCKHAAT